MCNKDCLDYPIHSLLHPNIYKAVDLLVHEVLFINYFLRDQAYGNLVVFMLRYDVVKVKLLTLTKRYPEPGVDMTLFQCIFDVVKSDVGVDTAP